MNLLKLSISILTIIVLSYCSPTLNTRNGNLSGEFPNTLKLIQGFWQSTEDSQASLRIENDSLFFAYNIDGIQVVTSYNIAITKKLPQYVKPSEKAEFLIWTNGSDTLNYEILGLSEQILSLQYYPSGTRSLYTRQ